MDETRATKSGGERGNLVLSRRKGEVLNIGDDITVKVVRVGPTTVRLAIRVPKGTRIIRAELEGRS